MKRSGILNGALAGELARLGHTDQVLICDSGMPIPRDVPTVDLAFLAGIPAFGDVFDGVVDELVIEGGIAAEEVVGANPECHALLTERIANLTYVPHDELKIYASDARLIIRTGEATPYANVLLRCGVAF